MPPNRIVQVDISDVATACLDRGDFRPLLCSYSAYLALPISGARGRHAVKQVPLDVGYLVRHRGEVLHFQATYKTTDDGQCIHSSRLMQHEGLF